VLKIHFKNMKKGFTLVELIAVVGVLLIITSVLLVNSDIIGNKKKARDTKRLSDLSVLDRAVNEYQMDTKVYPDTESVLRVSIILPTGNQQLENASSGWIDQDMSNYMSKIPTDPVNDATYHYSYLHNNSSYEINARLEYFSEKAQNDGGDDSAMYEEGNNLLLISP